MKQVMLIVAAVAALGCADAGTGSAPERSRTGIAKADSVGTCESACGDISAAGDCYCDDLCAEYGDCCADVAETCDLDECVVGDQNSCGPAAFCSPGLCYMYCPVGDPSCCAPAQCEPISCPQIMPPAPGFCADDEQIVSKRDDITGCVIGFECEKVEPTCCSLDDKPPAFEPMECCEDGTWQSTGSAHPCEDLGMEPGSICEEIHPGVCGDGTQALCTVVPEPCPDGAVREVVDHCFGECVNALTCLPDPTPL